MIKRDLKLVLSAIILSTVVGTQSFAATVRTQIINSTFNLSDGVAVKPDGSFLNTFPVFGVGSIDPNSPTPATRGSYATPVSDVRILQPSFLPPGAAPRGVISSKTTNAAVKRGTLGTVSTTYVPTAPPNKGGSFNSAGISSYTTVRLFTNADTTVSVFGLGTLLGTKKGAQKASLGLTVTATPDPFQPSTVTRFATSLTGGVDGFRHTIPLLKGVSYFLRFENMMGVTDLKTLATFKAAFGVVGAKGDKVVPLGFVPIPASAGMMLIAFAGLAGVGLRRRRRAA